MLASLAYSKANMMEYVHDNFGWDTLTNSNTDWFSPGRASTPFLRLQPGLFQTPMQTDPMAPPLLLQLTIRDPSHVLCCKHAQPILLQQLTTLISGLKINLHPPTQLQDALESEIYSWQKGEQDVN
jgi:hypothetical protein